MDTKLIADPMAFADAMQRDPRSRCVGDVVEPTIRDLPAGHRTLFNPVGQAAGLGFVKQGDELRLEHLQVRVHFETGVAPDEPTYRIRAEQHRGIENPKHEVMFLAAQRRVGHEHVVEVPKIRQPDPGITHGGMDPCGARAIERPP